MGLSPRKLNLSSRFVNVLIRDSSSRLRLVYLKNVVGEHFLADIDGQVYCFKIGEILHMNELFSYDYKFLEYSTKHYMPINPDNEALKLLLMRDHLPKIDKPLLVGLTELGKRQKTNPAEKDNPHKLMDAIEELNKKNISKNPKMAQSIKEIENYLSSLSIDEIVTPLSDITDHVHNELLATNPGYLGNVMQQVVNTVQVKDAVMNKPEKGKKSFILFFMVIGLMITIGTTLYFANSAGVFDSMFNGIGGGAFSVCGPDYTVDKLRVKYPSDAALRAGVDSGSLNYDCLPKDVKKRVDNTPSPSSIPTPPAALPPGVDPEPTG